MTRLEAADYQHLFRVESARLTQVDERDLRVDIPHLEGWTVQSVIGHTGWVYRFANMALLSDPDNPPRRSSVPEPPPGDEVIEWTAEGGRELEKTLWGIDLDSIHPTWTGPQPAVWWLRRIAHEVSMHRWDAESATTTPTPIDARQAVDGIDEVLEIFAPNRMQFDTLAGNGETVHLHASDVDHGEWVMTYHPDRIEWEHAHIKADVAARGSASDLLLLVWSRLPPSRLEIFGDVGLLDRWQNASAF
ncbi:MAG: maleylpyruvate isomerase family mycothiol-dependent enzyme [Acidimicrobiia bacterium]|nr:maleylpyruvate isomerase family mycothiol-dependent enzyme [Acidimicrobiia bacterium]